MKKVLVVLIVIFLSLVVQAKERTLEDALANSEKFLEKAGKFQKDFGKNEKSDNYPTTSVKLAIEFCRAFSDVDFDKMIYYCEKNSKVRLKKELKELKDSPEYYEYKDIILSASIKCKIDSVEDNAIGYKSYIFKSMDVIDTVIVDKVDGKFVVIDREYIKNKKNRLKTKGSVDFVKRAEQFIQQDYEKIQEVQAYYPPTPEKLAIAACEAIKNMDWNTLYSYTVTSYHDELKEQIKEVQSNKEKFKEDFSRYTCKIDSSDKIGTLKMKYHFNGLGSIYVEFLPELGNGWQVIRF